MRIAPHTPQCTSIAIPHNLSSCTSLHLIHLSAPQLPSLTNLNPQSSVLNPHCTTKCGTQKGPHTIGCSWMPARAHNIQLRIWSIYVKLAIMIWLILQTVSGTSKVRYFYVCTSSTSNEVQVRYQKATSHVFWIYLVLLSWWASKCIRAEQKSFH